MLQKIVQREGRFGIMRYGRFFSIRNAPPEVPLEEGKKVEAGRLIDYVIPITAFKKDPHNPIPYHLTAIDDRQISIFDVIEED